MAWQLHRCVQFTSSLSSMSGYRSQLLSRPSSAPEGGAVLGEAELDTISCKGTRLLTWQLHSDLLCHSRILGMSTRSPCPRPTQNTLPRAAGQQLH